MFHETGGSVGSGTQPFRAYRLRYVRRPRSACTGHAPQTLQALQPNRAVHLLKLAMLMRQTLPADRAPRTGRELQAAIEPVARVQRPTTRGLAHSDPLSRIARYGPTTFFWCLTQTRFARRSTAPPLRHSIGRGTTRPPKRPEQSTSRRYGQSSHQGEPEQSAGAEHPPGRVIAHSRGGRNV